jgi:hypothetical protein
MGLTLAGRGTLECVVTIRARVYPFLLILRITWAMLAEYFSSHRLPEIYVSCVSFIPVEDLMY